MFDAQPHGNYFCHLTAPFSPYNPMEHKEHKEHKEYGEHMEHHKMVINK